VSDRDIGEKEVVVVEEEDVVGVSRSSTLMPDGNVQLSIIFELSTGPMEH
jgi:hypothetical protein